MSQTHRSHHLLLWSILVVVGANYLAQIPYYLHLYYFPHHAAPALGGSLVLGLTLAWFLAGVIALLRGNGKGYWLLLGFLATEVFFYAYNMVNQVAHGFAPFFHLQTRDPILFVVFAIGYLNLLAGCYFLLALGLGYRDFTREPAEPAAHARAG